MQHEYADFPGRPVADQDCEVGPPSVPTPTASNTRSQIASIASERAFFCLMRNA